MKTGNSSHLPVAELYGRPMYKWTPPRVGMYREMEPRTLIAPFLSGEAPEWLGFYRHEVCAAERLCFCCGERVSGPMVLGRNTATATSGPGGHPVCMLYSVRNCPHFGKLADDVVIGWVCMDGTGLDMDRVLADKWSGAEKIDPRLPMVTYAQLRELAREYPER